MSGMKLFLIAVLFGTVQARANDAEAGRLLGCESLVVQKSLVETIGDLTRHHLDKDIQRAVLIRTKSAPPIREFDALVSHWREMKIDVIAEIREFRKEGDMTLIEFNLKGLGREIAKALLEISNPATNLDFGQYPVHGLVTRPRTTLPPLQRNPPSGAELNEVARLPIDRWDFSVRTSNFLRLQENIHFVGDLLVQSRRDLARRATKKIMDDIDQTAAEHGLRVGTEVPGWPFEGLELPKR